MIPEQTLPEALIWSIGVKLDCNSNIIIEKQMVNFKALREANVENDLPMAELTELIACLNSINILIDKELEDLANRKSK